MNVWASAGNHALRDRGKLHELRAGQRHIAPWSDFNALHYDGAGLLGFLDNFVKPLMGNDREAVNHGEFVFLVPGNTNTIGQAKAAAKSLFREDLRSRSPQRDNGVKVGYVPTFLELVHVDDNIGAVVPLQLDQAFHGVFILIASQG